MTTLRRCCALGERRFTVASGSKHSCSVPRTITTSHSRRATSSAIPIIAKQQCFTRHHFSTSRIARANSARLIKDPVHPSEVYYHQIEDSNQYAISFLEQPPSSQYSPSIIAFVNYPTSSKIPIYEYIQRKPDAVETNPAFIALLHDTMKKECVPQDGLIEYEAALRGSGWAHLNDQRHPLMPGRIATPENIIASVAFIDGELKSDSYEANNVYRVVTGEEGFMDLRPSWLTFIKKRCSEVN